MDLKSCHRFFERKTNASPAARPAFFLLALATLLTVGVAGCGKSPEKLKAEAAVKEAQTTGRLLVKSNRANATVEATLLPAAGAGAADSSKGTLERPLSGLLPGNYAVVARSEGWPDARGEATVVIGQTTEVTLDFKGGSLRLESEPTGATVKLGTTVLGKTPLLVPQLPPGECLLTLEYPAWPVLRFKTTITLGEETTETVRLPHGKLVVESAPAGATVLLGKRPLGPTPLTVERFQAGTNKLTLQAKDFPPLEIAVTMEDRGEVKVSPELGAGFPPLDPAALLRAVWVPDNPDRLSPSFEEIGTYAPKNGIVKNLSRRKLHQQWLRKSYRHTAIVKTYDQKEGEVEFAEETGELSKYRILARLSAGARADKELEARLVKGATLTFYGPLSAVEESRWPAKVMTFEFATADFLRAEPAPAP